MTAGHKNQKKLLFRIRCSVKDYAWGNPDPDGWIKKYCKNKHILDGSSPAAELWMGVHKSGPCYIEEDDRLLSSAILEDPNHMLGDIPEFSFLFKILDARKPLSIQTHPDRSLAEILHKSNPDNYPDANHKPEMAVCLRGMEALIGFRPESEIRQFMRNYPEAASILFSSNNNSNNNSVSEDKIKIKQLFESLMRSDGTHIAEAVKSTQRKINNSDSTDGTDKLFLKLVEEYGESDPGVFCAYLMNHVTLSEGEALFLAPGEPHAYISGLIVECMASSDNVIRAGLTSKFRDVDTLIEMLKYRMGKPEIINPPGKPFGFYSQKTDEFSLARGIASDSGEIALTDIIYPAILVVTKGSGNLIIENEFIEVETGDVLFLSGATGKTHPPPRIRMEKDGMFFIAAHTSSTRDQMPR